MKTSTQTALDQFQKNFDYYDSLVSIQADPRYYNALIVPIEKAIKSLKKMVADQKEKKIPDGKELSEARALLKKYLLLKKKYEMNHPWKNL